MELVCTVAFWHNVWYSYLVFNIARIVVFYTLWIYFSL